MILLFGFGGVGRTYAELLYERTNIKIAAVFDSGGGAMKKGGFTPAELKKLLEAPRGKVSQAAGRPASIEEALEETEVVVDVSPPNYSDGRPAVEVYRRALAAGRAVVTANKAPLALYFQEFRGRPIYYKATVMAGTPLLDLARGLPPQRVTKIRAILNGSTNYILTRVYKDGVPEGDAVEEAKRLGILEPDPSLDLGGVDAAAKLTILLNTLGITIQLNAVERKPLEFLGPVTKYLATWDGAKAAVQPVRLPPEDPLAKIDYTLNAAEVVTEVNTIFVSGKGAGRKETALVLINDTLKALKVL